MSRRTCERKSNGAVDKTEKDDAGTKEFVDFAHDRLTLLTFEGTVVGESERKLSEQREEQEDADDLMCGVEVLRLVVLCGDDGAASKSHAEENKSEYGGNVMGPDLLPDTEEEGGEGQEDDED